MKRIENDQNGNPRMQFGGKLVSPLSTTVLELNNAKRTKYKIANVEFINAKGQAVQRSATIFEGNYSKGELTVGETYLCTVTMVTNKETGEITPYIKMSHLVADADRATADDFDFVEVEDTAEAFMGTGTIRN